MQNRIPVCNDGIPDFFPVIDPRYSMEAGTSIMIGDTHGYTLTIIQMIMKFGGVVMNREDYRKLRDICLHLPLDIQESQNVAIKKRISDFVGILERLTFNCKSELLFLGDTLADRGSNDYLNLFLMYIFHKRKILFRDLLSNHTLEFFIASENEWKSDCNCYMDQPVLIQSVRGLRALIERKIITAKHVDALTDIYKSHVYPFYCERIGEDAWEIQTHSYSDREQIGRVAKELQSQSDAGGDESKASNFGSFFSATDEHKQKILDRAYKNFQKLVQAKNLTNNFFNRMPAFWDMIWERNPEEMRRLERDVYINGHDHNIPDTIQAPNFLSLDSNFGKTDIFTNLLSDTIFEKDYQLYGRGRHANFFEELNRIRDNIHSHIPLEPEELNDILDPRYVHSTWHLKHLELLLCTEEGVSDMAVIVGAIYRLPDTIIDARFERFKSNPALREVLFLLRDMNLWTEEIINRLMTQDLQYTLLLQILLIVENSRYPHVHFQENRNNVNLNLCNAEMVSVILKSMQLKPDDQLLELRLQVMQLARECDQLDHIRLKTFLDANNDLLHGYIEYYCGIIIYDSLSLEETHSYKNPQLLYKFLKSSGYTSRTELRQLTRYFHGILDVLSEKQCSLQEIKFTLRYPVKKTIEEAKVIINNTINWMCLAKSLPSLQDINALEFLIEFRRLCAEEMLHKCIDSIFNLPNELAQENAYHALLKLDLKGNVMEVIENYLGKYSDEQLEHQTFNL